MAKPSKTLQALAVKLGISEEEKVLSKAEEFERLLQMKSTVNNITDTAKAVICLDLAATYFRKDVDPKTAIKCSGLKGPSYTNSRKIIENALELNSDKLTIHSLCLTLQCNVQDLAEEILEKYVKNSKIELDMNLPQYVCMAVHQACRISKVKVPKSKLIDKSQLKPAQWSKLDVDWTKFVDEKFSTLVKKKKGRLAKSTNIEDEQKMEVDTENLNKTEETLEPQIESYEDWKSRVLEAAYKELEFIKQNMKNYIITSKQTVTDIKQKNSPNKQKVSPYKRKEIKLKLHLKVESDIVKPGFEISPRRSPRKSPQKLKSPPKLGGVRLLFPQY